MVFFAELGWAQPCDVWSTGCILFEYYRGFTLFQVGFLVLENLLYPEGLRIRLRGGKHTAGTKNDKLSVKMSPGTGLV